MLREDAHSRVQGGCCCRNRARRESPHADSLFYYIFSHNNCEVNKISKNDFTQGKTLPKMIKFIIAYNVISSIFRGLAAPAATVFGIMINLIYYIIYTKRTDKKQKLLNNVN